MRYYLCASLLLVLAHTGYADDCHDECLQQYKYCEQQCEKLAPEDYKWCRSQCGEELYDCNADCDL